MKLSEAIRTGAKLHPKARYDYAHISRGTVKTCAIGAAYTGVTGHAPSGQMDDEAGLGAHGVLLPIREATGIDWERVCRFPVEDERALRALGPDASALGCYDMSLYALITQLNDEADWTREEIADYLEGLGL